MKSQMMVMLIVSLISSNAFSITGKDRWQSIRAERDVLIQQPPFAQTFGPEGLFNACYTAEEFRSRTPVKNCLSYREVVRNSSEGTYKDYVCNEYENSVASLPRTYMKEVCTKHAPLEEHYPVECLERSTVVAVYPTSIKLSVLETEGEESGNFLFSKTYSLPACE